MEVSNPNRLRDGIIMFRFVLIAFRPLLVSELLHTLGIRGDLEINGIIHCGCNFSEIREHHGIAASYKDPSNS